MLAIFRKSMRWLVVIQVAFAVAVGCSSKDPATPTGTGPNCLAAPDTIVGWWPLDQLGTSAAELVDGNQGDYIGSPQEAVGKVSGALRFDGVDDLVEIADPGANWDYDIAGDITLETWIKRDSDQSGQQVLIGKTSAYFIGIRAGHIFSLIPNSFDFIGASTVPVGEWVHVAVTYDVAARAQVESI